MTQFAVILAAAGKSSRFGSPFEKKVYSALAHKPLWLYAAESFSQRQDVGQVLLVIAAEDQSLFQEKFSRQAAELGVQIVLGGQHRADSVWQGLQAVRSELPLVAIHDAARPCLTAGAIDAVFAAAQKSGAAILATPCTATLKRVGPQQTITDTVSRENLWLAQTPQVFEKALLRAAWAAHPNPSAATDEASLVEAMGRPVTVVEGSPLNVKVTTRADLEFAELALRALPKPNPFPYGK
ncbi:MAG: 2-C-methyl-D-erythritol 4-phosphate cytidylyltransferase [Planctomycetales bacterium]|nr:2-C-methyl-D-erythritol 4-phosphate cytidylyltransferase [Planctomycetales bacterium]